MNRKRKHLILTIVIFITIPIWLLPFAIKAIGGDAWDMISAWVEKRMV